MEIESQVALITGASTGIGQATAAALAREGCQVILSSRSEDKLHEVATEIDDVGGKSTVLPFDLQVDSNITSVVETIDEEFGQLDILVNNAGVGDWQFDDIDNTTIRTVNEVNLVGLQQLTFAALPLLRESGSGHIVNVSSLSGRGASGGSPMYSAAKAGVNTFSESLTRRLRTDPIRVTLVEPGTVDTPMQPEEERGADWMLQPEDIADAVIYAISRPRTVSVYNISVIPSCRPDDE